MSRHQGSENTGLSAPGLVPGQSRVPAYLSWHFTLIAIVVLQRLEDQASLDHDVNVFEFTDI